MTADLWADMALDEKPQTEDEGEDVEAGDDLGEVVEDPDGEVGQEDGEEEVGGQGDQVELDTVGRVSGGGGLSNSGLMNSPLLLWHIASRSGWPSEHF